MTLIIVPAVQIRALLLIPQQHFLYTNLVYLKKKNIYIYIYAALMCNIIDRSNNNNNNNNNNNIY